ncbi:hypothetical protein [Halpernia frigidisoli]|uniref:Uncharacterized protein n=1 Tax=Halpernia frigidisoli TaxID=1125876 RepID=A0A1I3CXJ6_9FLAO|nr:hypothetical protein [Halpernia frigidisoli]SFH79215.1 hypothetical protein SAMN05443292_0139 [Halpernia frigidisoli]
MKKQLTVYGILILIYLTYNFFFKIQDDKINAAIDIIFASLIFGYISYLAFTVLKRMNKKT